MRKPNKYFTMKNFLSLVAAFLLVVSQVNALNPISVDAKLKDCYQVAFDAMDDASDAGMTDSQIQWQGEIAYCFCASNCFVG